MTSLDFTNKIYTKKKKKERKLNVAIVIHIILFLKMQCTLL